MENKGLGSASFKLRPSFIQTHPKSKTSNVWARGEKSDDWDFQKSTWEGSGKESGFLLHGVPGSQPRKRATALPARVSSQCSEISASHHIHTQPISPCLASLQEPQMASVRMFLRSCSKHDQL